MDSFDAPTVDPQGISPSAAQALIPESLYGRFGKYQIVEKVGQGGMGAVYRARDTVLERQVAIKVPLLDRNDRDSTLGRFSREAVAAATLRHPSICPVFEFSEFENIPFIVTPFLSGRSLQDCIEQDLFWPLDRSLRMGVRLARALGYAHQNNVVHRDIKPQNIFIETDGTPIILDFGLAKISQANQLQWTQSGEILGTPAYMPPEQIDTRVGPIGPASDIYALGMTLYRLLTGRSAFGGEAQFMIPQILMDRPRAPSSVVPDRDELKRVDALLLKSLEKKPKDRFASMSEFADAMQRILDGDDLAAEGTVRLPDLRIVGSGHRYHPSRTQQSIRIGRQRSMPNNPEASANDLVIRADGNQDRSLRISRQHLEIVTTQSGLGLVDRSQAGVSINGRTVKRGEVEPLAIGDILSVAGVLEIEILPWAEKERNQLPPLHAAASPVGFEATMGDFYKDESP